MVLEFSVMVLCDVVGLGLFLFYSFILFYFSHLADAFVQSDLQMRAIEAIKTNKTSTTCKCYDKSWLA